MKQHIALKITSVLAAIFFSLHWADEVARGLEPGTLNASGGLLILAAWLSATLVFSEKRWGLVLVLLAAILASGVPVLHMTGRGWVLGRYGTGSNLLFWVWTNIALGVCGMLSFVLAVRALWESVRSGRQRQAA